MTGELVVRNTMRLNASANKVWEALTNPELTKKYKDTIAGWEFASKGLRAVVEKQS